MPLEVHDALARIGAQLETEVGSDATLLELTVLERHRRPAASSSSPTW